MGEGPGNASPTSRGGHGSAREGATNYISQQRQRQVPAGQGAAERPGVVVPPTPPCLAPGVSPANPPCPGRRLRPEQKVAARPVSSKKIIILR